MNSLCTGRRGVILLVILGMLALFMLVGVSFVVTSTHARSSALATLSIEQTGDNPDREISSALLNVARGSRSPRSAIGPHSILEDLYGERDSVVGVVRYAASDIPASMSYLMSTPSNGSVPIYPQYTGSSIVNTDHTYSFGELTPIVAISFGPDRTPGLPGVDDDGNGQIDDNYDVANDKLSLGQVVSGSDDFYLGHQVTPGLSSTTDIAAQLGMGADAVIGHYAGRLLTMLDGPLARQSTRIVWSYPVSTGNGGACYWVLVVRPFRPGLPSQPPVSNGAVLYNVKAALASHRFVINGRPFNGQGFGYNPLNGIQVPNNPPPYTSPPVAATNPRLLNLSHYHLDMNQMELPFPFALLPNPTDRRYRDYLADRSSYTSSGNPNGMGSDTYSITPFTWYTQSLGMIAPSLTNPYGVDADEDYDAPDYQNLHMAWRVWNPMMGVPMTHNLSVAATPGGRWQTRIPSFHRPELVNYWLQYIMSGSLQSYGISSSTSNTPTWYGSIPGGESNGGQMAPRLRQRAILRPDPQDNFDVVTQDTIIQNGRWDGAEMFQDTNGNGIWNAGEPTQSDPTGSTPARPAEPDWSGNTYFNPINGPWDVDNDNDGEPDSVWIDLGSPVNSGPDGKQYKPLFAILCLDMDGRLNINAHGNNSHVNYVNYETSVPLTSVAALPTNTVSDDAIMVGMWQVHSRPGGAGTAYAPIYTRTQSIGPFAGGFQNPATVTTSTSQYYLLSQPSNNPSLSLGTGLGFSVADINLGPLLGPPFNTYESSGTNSYFIRQAEYRFLLQGKSTNGSPNVAVTSLQHLGQPISGRYGEPHLLNYTNPLGAAKAFPQLFPQAGVTWGQQPNMYTPFGPVYDSYDDNVPAAGSPMNQVIPNPINLRGNGFQAALPTPLIQQGNPAMYVQPSTGITSQGSYGSPVDPFGNLMVGLDFRGQPVYANLPSVYPATFNPLIDDPWELDLSPKGKRTSYAGMASTTGSTSTVRPFISDAPFTPGELETLLRYGDPDLATLQSRPVQLFGLAAQDTQITTNLRNRVTTESWDLPCPNIQPTPEIVRGLQMLGLPTTNCSFADLVRGKIAFVQGLNIYNNPPSASNPGALALANEQTLLLLTGRVVQVGFQNSNSASITTAYARTLPAFSSDLLMGLRMDLNRTFGNSWDDNGNGAIDDPDELTRIYANPLAGELLWRLSPTTPNSGYHPDPNNDGVANYYAYPVNSASAAGIGPNPSGALVGSATTSQNAMAAYDVSARAEMAKHLYMLMMLLTDSDWMYFYPTTQAYLPASQTTTTPLALGTYTPNSPAPLTGNLYAGFANVINNPPLSFTPGSVAPLKGGNPVYVMNAQQKLAAYRIAQWAVNAVDFADRDAIMTGFEFDLSPFNCDGYSVDGHLGSYCSCWTNFPNNGTTLPSYGWYYEPDRAVVWGMEYPDLLITETTAFHDKAWADTALDSSKEKNGMPTSGPKDTDWDQARMPQGSLFVELYCPGKPNSPAWPTLANQNSYPSSIQANVNSPYLPTELYDVVTPAPNYGVGTSSTNPSRTSLGAGYANVGTLDLERMTPLNASVTGGTQQYPVWRLALARGTVSPRPAVGTSYTTPGSTLNPSVPQPPLAPNFNVSTYPSIRPIGTYMATTGGTATNVANGGQSLQNRFMMRPDTTTVMPFTSLSTHVSNPLYSQRYQALSGLYPATSVPATVPPHSSQAATALPTPPVLDSYVVTDFIDSTAANLSSHVLFLQRFVYFCRPVANTPSPVPQSTVSSAYGVLAYPPYLPRVGSTTPLYTMTQSGAMAQTIYQFRPQNTGSGGNAGTTQPRLLLHPGSYAVVGPRRSKLSPAHVMTAAYEDVTFIGYNDGKTIKTAASGTTAAGVWYPQAIDLGTHIRPYHLLNPVMMLTPANAHANNDPVKCGGYPNNIGFMTTKIKNPLCIPCASGAPWPLPTTTTASTQVDRGLNISEPPQGYVGTTVIPTSQTSVYTSGNSSAMAVTVEDTWVSPTAASGSTSAGTLPKIPFDAPIAGLSTEPWASGNSGKGTGTCSRTLIDYSTVFLQRLADPTRPWDPTVNPYLTIDWMPIDLTVFNGQNVFQGTAQPMTDTSYLANSSGGPSAPSMIAFETRQRGPRNMVQSSAVQSNPAAFPAQGTLLGPAGLPAAATQAYVDPGGMRRWPVTSIEYYPFRYVIPTTGTTTAAAGNWPTPASNQVNTSYTNLIEGYNNEYQAVTEAPLWCQMSDDPRENPTQVTGQAEKPSPMMAAATGASFTAYLYGTLGFLNEGYGVVDFNYTSPIYGSPSAIDAYHSLNPTNSFLYRLNAYYATISGTTPQTLYDYVGDPARPFPWLTWNNRPYASAMELLLVPASQPARFGWEYTYKTTYTDPWTVFPTDPTAVPGLVAPATTTPLVIPGGALWDSHYAWRPNPSWCGLRPGSASASSAAYFTSGTYLTTGPLGYPPAPSSNTFGISGIGKYSFIGWPGPVLSNISAGAGKTVPTVAAGGYPFGHLLNFFGSNGPQACTPALTYPYTAASAATPPAGSTTSFPAPIDPLVGAVGNDINFGNGNLPAVQPNSNFHRIFEYVHVPSRFSGTQELLDPVIFNVNYNAHATNPNSSLSHFMAPYNRVSRYREPGRINLNTISDTWLRGNTFTQSTTTVPAPYFFAHQPDIFQGLMNDFPGYKHIWDNLLGGLQIQDPRGADKAWGFARNYVSPSQSQPSVTGDDDYQFGNVNYYGFGQTDDQWEAGWPGSSGYQLNANGYPTLYTGSTASDDWIPASGSSGAKGMQTLVAGAPNERLLNHLSYNPSAGYMFTGPSSSTIGDLPYGSGAYFIPPMSGVGALGNLGMPTFFPNPFRSFCTGYGVPVPQMLYWWPAVSAGPFGGGGGVPLNGNNVGLTSFPMPFYWADSSLFRRSRAHPTRRYEPLFVANSYNWWSPGGTPANSGSPAWELPYLTSGLISPSLLAIDTFTTYPYPDPISRVAPHQLSGKSVQPGEWGESFRDTNRNPYFRYQPLIKLSNMVTTHSNVYAIWVTVGYFEVQRAKLDATVPQATFDRNPDGYRLVRELGSDTGNVRRHRGFAIFDRTLPMGFLRGENLNVNDGFLVKRTIE